MAYCEDYSPMFAFLFSAFAISLFGVLSPGPISAATLAAGSRQRHAGAMIAVGHALVEFPLILLLALGVANFLESSSVRAAIGLAGGVVLVLMGLQLLLSVWKPDAEAAAPMQRHALVTGIVVTAASPYFWVWWATAGLALTTAAMAFGAAVLVLFAIVHWLCDLGWMEVLSLAGFKGSELFGRRSQGVVSAVCGIMLLGFGIKFLYDGGTGLHAAMALAAIRNAS